MKKVLVSVGCTAAILVGGSVALAQGRGNGPKPKLTTAAPARGGSTTHGSGATHGGAQHATAPKTTQSGPKSHGSTIKSTHTTGSSRPSTSKAPTKHDSTTTATTTKHAKTTTTVTTTTGTLTPVQMKLQRNTNLASKLQSRLPLGTDLMAASEGFRNLGQFVAAVNVSNNLGLDFAKLKTAMVNDRMSLGQAIQSQRTSVDATAEATRAQRQADSLIRSTDTVTTKPSAPPQKKTSGRVNPVRSSAG
jgi:hypothetical protein